MRNSILASVAALGILTVIARAALPVSAQDYGIPPLVITAFNGGTAASYVVPRTPWGDPDLQGSWTSDDASFPVSRPRNQAGLYLSDDLWAQRQKQIQTTLANSDNEGGAFRNDIARRAFRQTSAIVDPVDGRMPAFTPEAEKRRAPRDFGTFGDGPFDWTTDFTLYDRCITRGIVYSAVRSPYGNGVRIFQSPGMVVISYEMVHDTRVIYTDGRPHINKGLKQYLGNSRGHWEGDVLVVETTNLTDQTSIDAPNGRGLRHSDRMKLTEKIKRVARDIVQYQVTVEDPVTFLHPFTLSLPWTPLQGGRLLPYECHEGNHGLENILAAERAEDRAIEEDRRKGIIRPRRPVQNGLGVAGQPLPGAAGGAADGEAGPPLQR
jgi:hypothetical protein